MSDLIVEVCKINKIEKHPNADRLAIATIKGWTCIVGLDAKEGDLVIFCPIDSVIPEKIIDEHQLEYLRKDGRVKTVKLRGVISQGLALTLPKGSTWKEGQDVAKELGIIKYEPKQSQYLQINGKPTRRKKNPLFDKYTNINNIKNYNTVFKIGEEVVITEKIHGTNFRAGNLKRYEKGLWNRIKSFFFGAYEFVYESHNVQINGCNRRKGFYGEDVYGKIAKKYDLANKLPKDCIIYGEIYGKNIQDLNYDLDDIDLRVFDIKVSGEYLCFDSVTTHCHAWGLKVVPVLYKGKLKEGMIEKYTKGKSTIASHMREGCVIKPLVEEKNLRIGRKILKSINPEYLLKKDRTDYH